MVLVPHLAECGSRYGDDGCGDAALGVRGGDGLMQFRYGGDIVALEGVCEVIGQIYV